MNAATTSLRLDQNGQHLSVTEEHIGLLGDLHGRRITSTRNGEGGVDHNWTHTSLLRAEDRSRLSNAGLYPALKYRATQAGIELRRTITPRLAEVPAPQQSDSLLLPHLADFIHRHERGLVEIPPQVRLENLLIDLVTAFPGIRFVVIGVHLRQLKKLSAAMRSREIDAVWMDSPSARSLLGHLDDDELPGVILSTPTASAAIPTPTIDIVTLLDALTCGRRDVEMALARIDGRFRLLGLARSHRKPDAPSMQDRLFSVFGPECLVLGRDRTARRETHVAWLPTPAPRVPEQANSKALMDACYWHHERRNRRIRQLGEALLAGDPIRWDESGHIEEFLCSLGGRTPIVTVLVERPDHLRNLAEEMPEWPIVAEPASVERLGGGLRSRVRRDREQWNTGSYQMVLRDSAERFEGQHSDVVIWAGGGPLGNVPQSWLFRGHGSEKPLLIIDFEDHHNTTAADLQTERERSYRERNLYPVGISMSMGRMATFLHRQPEGGCHE